MVPGALHAALTVLEKWGTLSFETVSARAIEYARDGFPLRQSTADGVVRQLEFFKQWPDNQRYWLKADGTPHKAGETIKLPTLARTLTRMVEAERAAKGRGRAAAVAAARDRFYKGDIAKEMVAFLQKHQAPFDASDFAEYFARIEEPASTTYRGYTVYKHGFSSQGPVMLQALNILETFDLAAMRHDSADYVHTVTEAMKLAYADRDTYYADTAFVQVPGEGLLSKAYAKERAALINPRQASRAFIAGDPLAHDSEGQDLAVREVQHRRRHRHDRRRRRLAGDVERIGLGGSVEGHHPHGRDRQGRQRLRRHAERRLGARRGDPRRHRHRDERARRAVLARQDPRQPDPPAGPAALHADAEPGLQGRPAADGAGHARRRQPGPDHPAGLPQHRRVLGSLVSRTSTARSSGRASRRCTSTARSGRTTPASTS